MVRRFSLYVMKRLLKSIWDLRFENMRKRCLWVKRPSKKSEMISLWGSALLLLGKLYFLKITKDVRGQFGEHINYGKTPAFKNLRGNIFSLCGKDKHRLEFLYSSRFTKIYSIPKSSYPVCQRGLSASFRYASTWRLPGPHASPRRDHPMLHQRTWRGGESSQFNLRS